MRYFLGADLGSTKTHMTIADEDGRIIGFARSGAGNYQVVGFDGMLHSIKDGLTQVLASSRLSPIDIQGAGFGIAGFDWPSEETQMAGVISQLGMTCPIKMVNDAILALYAGAEASKGVALVSGTGCNCRGWDPNTQKEGRVTGFGTRMGEFAGASELVWKAMQLVAQEWTKRGPTTHLSAAFIKHAGATDLADLLEGYTKGYYQIDASAALLVFEVAELGDAVALELIRWAGTELGEMAKAVIRQLVFESQVFDVVLAGSMFGGGPLLIDPMWETIHQFAPDARMVHLQVPPVVGAVILGMAQGGIEVTDAIRQNLIASMSHVKVI
jgi:N-acetylglucosamine kinase-like BadF-type ATPase